MIFGVPNISYRSNYLRITYNFMMQSHKINDWKMTCCFSCIDYLSFSWTHKNTWIKGYGAKDRLESQPLKRCLDFRVKWGKRKEDNAMCIQWYTHNITPPHMEGSSHTIKYLWISLHVRGVIHWIIEERKMQHGRGGGDGFSTGMTNASSFIRFSTMTVPT